MNESFLDIKVTTKIFLQFICLLIASNTRAQDDFKIGFYNLNVQCTLNEGQCFHEKSINGNPTSPINILASNGANIIGSYINLWHSLADIEDVTTLTKKNNCQFMFSAFPSVSYLPKFESVDGKMAYTGQGRVFFKNNAAIAYNQSAASAQMVYLDASTVFSQFVANNSNIWAIRVIDEPHVNHAKWTANVYQKKAPYCTETPPEKVDSFFKIFDEFRNSYNSNTKIALSLANHGRSINSNTNDIENDSKPCPFVDKVTGTSLLQNDIYDTELNQWVEKDYNPQDYLYIPKSYTNTVLFEGSYGAPNNTYANRDYSRITRSENHFLGFLKSIDFLAEHSNHVHKIIDLGHGSTTYYSPSINEYSKQSGQFRIYNATNVDNASWLWFQAYTSIIHGVRGIWFYNLGWNSTLDRRTEFYNDFEFDQFPTLYQKLTSNLTKELAYLNNKGYLKKENLIAKKLDSEVENSLVPNFYDYLAGYEKEYVSEKYGLRYTLRHNDSNAILIIANPTPFELKNIEINLEKANHPLVKNANSFKVLFEENNDIESANYKTNRIGFENKNPKYYPAKKDCSFADDRFMLDFAPFDVHIIELNSIKHHRDSIYFYPNPSRDRVTLLSYSDFEYVNRIMFYSTDGKLIEVVDSFESSLFTIEFQECKTMLIAIIEYKNGCTRYRKLMLL